MQIFIKKIFILLLILSISLGIKSQTGKFTLTGKVINTKKEKLHDVLYKLYKNNTPVDSALTSVQGSFNIKFDLNSIYLLEFSKKGFVSKKIIIDTQIPKGYTGKFYKKINIVILDSVGKGDLRSEAGLPVLKYYFNLKEDDFVSENISGNKNNEKLLFKHIEKLKKEINHYKNELEKQKELLSGNPNQNQQDSLLIREAQIKADKIIANARHKASLILEASKKDSADRASSLEKATKNITDEDFETLNVDEKEFKEKQAVITYQKQIQELTQRQNKTAEDSLDIQEHKLSLRKEFIELARAKLENDRLMAKTHEDSLKIQQREAELFLIEQNMQMAAKEIDAARKELALKDLQLRQKNIIIYGTLIGLLLLFILLIVIYRHYREKKKMNQILEAQNKKLEEQNNKISAQNHQIMESIKSGERIQSAILPSNQLLTHFFPDSFVFFLPRDVVSGDFYWFSVQDNKLFVAAVDCTGHGVPGAFMSLIGNTLLNHIVNEKGIYTPSEILKELHLGVRQALSQSRSEESEDHADGMDISLCRFDKKNKEIKLALANHTAFILNKGEITEIEGDEFGIADELIGDDKPEFTDHTFPMNKDATLYMFSDGFPDQFGGPKNKKFYISNLKKLFIKNEALSMQEQYNQLSDKFKEWKGNNRQFDDVLVMGFKLDL